MALVCSACSYQNPDHARFCSGCGADLAADRAQRDPLFGTLVEGRYLVKRVLGEGGMGKVYFAEQQMGNAMRPVALKVLRTELTDERTRARFYRECELVVQLNHPSTIRFYDFGGLADGRLYIAMEFIDGRSLTKAIEGGPMPLAMVDRIVGQVGGALIEAHRRGIVHRDLKPDNILLAQNVDEGEFAKVLDFGIAKRSDEEGEKSDITGEGLIVGTPAYMSPEQLEARPVDERSDVYAFALIVFEMLVGRRIYEAKTPLEWATAHITKAPPSFDDFPATQSLPAHKRNAIYRALTKVAADRTPSVRIFLEEFLGGERMQSLAITPSVERPPVSPNLAPHDTLPTSRAPLYALGAMLALGAGAGIAYVATRPPAPVVPVIPDAGIPDAGSDAPVVPTQEWFRMVTGTDRTRDPTNALGAPDGQCAEISPRGKILLELPNGQIVETDHGATPDLNIVVREGSAAYRVDVLIRRNEDQTRVGADVVGSMQIDVDQFERETFRYVRVKNPNAQGTVCLDAVGYFVAPESR
jgi:serine/threonine-protein kinase